MLAELPAWASAFVLLQLLATSQSKHGTGPGCATSCHGCTDNVCCCPASFLTETLLLDLEAVVVLQNELQRLCLVAASLLVVQQVREAEFPFERHSGGGSHASHTVEHVAHVLRAVFGSCSSCLQAVFRLAAPACPCLPAVMAKHMAKHRSSLHPSACPVLTQTLLRAPLPPWQILAAQRALPPAGSPQHAALCFRLVRRVGLLLSAGANLDALAAELHAQVEQEMAASAAKQQEGVVAGEGGDEAAAGMVAASSSGGSGGPSPAELATVKRMIEGIFSTSHTVYQRVQVGLGYSSRMLEGRMSLWGRSGATAECHDVSAAHTHMLHMQSRWSC